MGDGVGGQVKDRLEVMAISVMTISVIPQGWTGGWRILGTGVAWRMALAASIFSNIADLEW